MEFIIDTVDLEEIKDAVEHMPIVGVTSNPSIVKRTSPENFFDHMRAIRSIIGKERFDCSFERGEDALFMAKLSKNVKVIRTSSSDAVYYRRLRNGSASRKGLSVWERLRDNARLAKAYTLLYVMGFPHYDALFFATRFCALARNCLFVLKKTA